MCDCCDGSDEGNVVKCPNVCAAAAMKEKHIIEKLSAAYNVGSAIRAGDIDRIEKSKATLTAQFEPLKLAVDKINGELENLKIKKANAIASNKRIVERINNEVETDVGNLLDLHNMADTHITKLLSSMFDVLDMTDFDVNNALIAAGIEIVASGVPSSMPNAGGHDSIENYTGEDDPELDPLDEVGDAEEGDKEEDHDHDRSQEQDVSSKEPSSSRKPFHCTLLDHIGDVRLAPLCNHRPADDASEEPESLLLEQTKAHSSAIDNAKVLLLQLLKSKGLYTEIMLLTGYFRVRGTFEGAPDFIKTHKLLDDPHSCPAEWSGHENVNDLCSLNELLFGMYDSLNFIEGKNPASELDLKEMETDLSNRENELDEIENSLKDFELYSDKLEYLALKDKCFDGKDGKFTYSVCILDKLTQRDTESGDGGEVTLGTYSSIETNPDTGGIVMHFTEGQHCWAFGERTADVFITCGPEQKMISSNEPTTCYYTFQVESPSGCTEEYAQLNGLI